MYISSCLIKNIGQELQNIETSARIFSLWLPVRYIMHANSINNLLQKELIMAGLIALLSVYIIIFIVIIYDTITFPIYLLIQSSIFRLKKSNIKKIEEFKIGNSNCKTYTFGDADPKIEGLYENVITLPLMIRYSAENFGYKKCLGSRDILSRKEFYQTDGTSATKYLVGSYKWITYNAVKDEVLAFSQGICSLGLEPKNAVALFAETRVEWMLSALACFERGIKLVALDLNMEAKCLAKILNETGASLMITSYELIPKVLTFIHHVPVLKFIIYMELNQNESIVSSVPETVTFYTYADICNRGKKIIIEGNPPGPDDVAVLMFSSGSTGAPKGVILSHRNLISTILCYVHRLQLNSNDVMIAYLALSNVSELVLELAMMMAGGSIGYSSNLAMSDSPMHILFGSQGDTTLLQPTIMSAYPFLLEKIRKEIAGRIKKSGTFSRNLMKFGISYKSFWLLKGFGTPLTNRLVFSRTAAMAGGKLRIIICGGAYTPAETQIYATVTLCSAVVLSYGLTETSSAGLCQNLVDLEMGRIGKPLSRVYVRLEETLQSNQLTNRTLGELILGGDCVSKEYFNLPDKTNEDYLQDGNIQWFRTKDIAIMHSDGSFEFVDRKMDIVELGCGKYVALGRLEALYRMNKYIENILLHADKGKKCLVAVLVPSPPRIYDLAKPLGLLSLPLDELFSQPRIKSALAEVITKHAKSCKLSVHEIPAAITVVDRNWTPASGMVTSSHKFRRTVIYDVYEAQIQSMHEKILDNNGKGPEAILMVNGETE